MQVKLRGLRIELGEIERVISGSPGVNAATVTVHKHPATKQDVLVAYATPSSVPTKDCLQACRQHLPKFMVPAVITPLKSFPLLPNGKLDSNSLPEPDWSSEGQSEEKVAPSTPTEETLQKIWTQVLGKEDISVTADFFELGGTSLVAGVLLGKINKRMGTSESIAVVFRCPTIRSLASHMQAATQGEGEEEIPQLAAEDKAPGMALPGTPKQELWHGLYHRYITCKPVVAGKDCLRPTCLPHSARSVRAAGSIECNLSTAKALTVHLSHLWRRLSPMFNVLESHEDCHVSIAAQANG